MINKGLSRLGIFFLYLISLLPFWCLYIIADILFVFFYYVTGYRRKVVRENLRNSYPEKTDKDRLIIEKQYFKYLADLVVETIKMITASEKTIRKHMWPTNAELIDNYLTQGKSIIGAVGHYCNWEMAALRFSMIIDERRMIVYKPLTNSEFDGFFLKIRSRFGATLVAMKDTLRTLIKYKNEATFTVLVADQIPVKHEANYFTNFLNQPTAVFLGIEKLSKMTDSVVVFCDVQRVKRGYYSYTFVPLIENAKETALYEITETHVKYLEGMINRHPQYWLWSHRRWKFKPEDKL
ncbi:lysophospholipid acyltransferase family protein [Mucilaginibacter sp.]